MVENHEGVLSGVKPFSGKHGEISHEATKKLRMKTHQTIAKVESDFNGGYHFNTAIAAIMELVNEIYTYPVQLAMEQSRAVLREAIEATVRLLNPFAPHVTEELWERLGCEGMLIDLQLPKPDADALVRDVLTIVVQVNGKLRANVQAGVSLSQEQIAEMAKADPKVAHQLEGKQIVKTIYVPGKLLNFVVK
jgi:leucyl-tRNA synthetase